MLCWRLCKLRYEPRAASSSLLWTGCHRADTTGTEQCRCDSLHSLCRRKPRGKGRPSAAELAKAPLNSHRTKASRVCSPKPGVLLLCLSQSPREIQGESSQPIRRFLRQISGTLFARFVAHVSKIPLFPLFPWCLSALRSMPYIACQVWFVKPKWNRERFPPLSSLRSSHCDAQI